jgi:hypothetical protein
MMQKYVYYITNILMTYYIPIKQEYIIINSLQIRN